MGKQAEEPREPAQKNGNLAERVSNSRVMIWITIVGTILGIVGFVLQVTIENKKSELSVSLNYHNREMQVGQSDTLIPTVKPSEGAFEYIWKSDNETAAMVSTTGVVRLLDVGSATITLIVKDNKGESVQSSCLYIVHPEGYVAADSKAKTAEKTVAPKSANTAAPVTAAESAQNKPAAANHKASSSELNLGYATYDGDTRDGQPHGNGILTFSSSHLIPGTVDCTANPGEKVIGTFREGKVNMGTWYRNDGTQLMVKLGQKYNY